MLVFPQFEQNAIQKLHQNGYEAYAVGGCIRDMIIGKIPYDFDITTNALPHEIEQVFYDYKTLNIGKKHGTITVIFENNTLEITTYRIDGAYIDNRHPEAVNFTRILTEDLSRRDFTMNALCCDGEHEIIDLFHGMTDIQNGIIRVIGDGEKRFSEDALRILRAFRFMSKLGFTIEEETCRCIRKKAPLLANISKERILSELKSILLGNHPQKALSMMQELGVMNEILPSVACQNEVEKAFEAIERAEDDIIIRLALLFANCTQSKIVRESLCETKFYDKTLAQMPCQMVAQVLKDLRCDNKTIKEVVQIIEEKDKPFFYITKQTVKHYMNSLTIEGFRRYLSFQTALWIAQGKDIAIIMKAERIINEVIGNNECYCKEQLAINGNDLLELGIEGKAMPYYLDRLLGIVIEDNSKNQKEWLISVVKNGNLF